jgi:hypothetical protein
MVTQHKMQLELAEHEISHYSSTQIHCQSEVDSPIRKILLSQYMAIIIEDTLYERVVDERPIDETREYWTRVA